MMSGVPAGGLVRQQGAFAMQDEPNASFAAPPQPQPVGPIPTALQAPAGMPNQPPPPLNAAAQVSMNQRLKAMQAPAEMQSQYPTVTQNYAASDQPSPALSAAAQVKDVHQDVAVPRANTALLSRERKVTLSSADSPPQHFAGMPITKKQAEALIVQNDALLARARETLALSHEQLPPQLPEQLPQALDQQSLQGLPASPSQGLLQKAPGLQALPEIPPQQMPESPQQLS